MWPNPQFPVDLVTFTEEILNWKLHFFCSAAPFSKNGRNVGIQNDLLYFIFIIV